MPLGADTRKARFARLAALFDEPVRDEVGRTARERFLARKLGLGLFLPNMSGAGGGYFPTDLDSGTEPTFAYNLRCAQLVDELGFDFVFPVGRWAGDGGRTWFNEFTLEVCTLTTALAALTRRVMVFTTWHVSYHFHPMHVAKMGATIDHISGGRWGLNVVTGWKEREMLMFGRPLAPREERYRLGAEFASMLKRLWSADEPIDLDGEYFRGTGCVVLPKPVQRPSPLLINAGQSPEGIAFATEHCDVIFIQGGSGDASSDVDAVADVTRHVREAASQKGRSIRIVLPVVLVCRDTEREALDLRRRILEHADWEAAETMLRSLTTGSSSWPRHTLEPIVLGIGGFKFFGTPEQATDLLLRLNAAGVDGVQFEFWRYAEEIEYFGREVLPLIEQAGLRELAP
jgi:FMNH2-dependent dimethyl sulfone monooxygenase